GNLPLLVGCPSCKVGLSRITAAESWPNEVLHTLEFLARTRLGRNWRSRAETEIVNHGITEAT
ncbi:MAG: hypothetical protein V5A14_01755, partial [Desulfohalobiaceae bacterium]